MYTQLCQYYIVYPMDIEKKSINDDNEFHNILKAVKV